MLKLRLRTLINKYLEDVQLGCSPVVYGRIPVYDNQATTCDPPNRHIHIDVASGSDSTSIMRAVKSYQGYVGDGATVYANYMPIIIPDDSPSAKQPDIYFKLTLGDMTVTSGQKTVVYNDPSPKLKRWADNFEFVHVLSENEYERAVALEGL